MADRPRRSPNTSAPRQSSLPLETLSDTAGTVPDTDAVVAVPAGKFTVTSAAVVPDGTAGRRC